MNNSIKYVDFILCFDLITLNRNDRNNLSNQSLPNILKTISARTYFWIEKRKNQSRRFKDNFGKIEKNISQYFKNL